MRAMALALAAVCLFAYACSEDSVDPAERAAARQVVPQPGDAVGQPQDAEAREEAPAAPEVSAEVAPEA